MRPKQKTRKLRGDVPVSQVLLIVLGVAVVAALVLVVFPVLGSVRAPTITLDAYNTKALGGVVIFSVKTGSTITFQGASLRDLSGNQLAACTAHPTMNDALDSRNSIQAGSAISGGSAFYIRCAYAVSPGKYLVKIDYKIGNTVDSVLLEWVYS